MKWFWRAMSVALALVIIGGGITYGVRWATTQWTKYGCFTVNYVDLRGGYAPSPALYTTIGVIDNYADENVYMGDIGKWHAGDRYCGPITYGNGQRNPIVFFGPRVDTSHEFPPSPFAPPPTVGDAP